jgi:hypothetical protein
MRSLASPTSPHWIKWLFDVLTFRAAKHAIQSVLHVLSCNNLLLRYQVSFSKFPNNPEATHAFQKVSVAYDVLSKPSSRRIYDSRKSSSPYNYFSTQPAGHAEDTFRGVIIGVFNDFLDGDLEMIRTLLRGFVLPRFRCHYLSTSRIHERYQPDAQTWRRQYWLHPCNTSKYS